ncbi:MAG: hypothetical protein ACLFVG_04425 [Candidatus Aminicenantes bacterium]
MKKWSIALMIVLASGLISQAARSEVKLKGCMFADYYYVASHHSGPTDEGGVEGRHGFWLRRIYFTAENKLADNIKVRLRLEMSSPGKFPFDSSDKVSAVVKDAYLSCKTGRQELFFGIVSTPTFGHHIEDIWGYRSLEKTPLDLMKMASSRDFGIGLKGSLDEGKTVNYYILFGNGASNRGETDKGKKIYGSLAFKPVRGLTLEAYGDYEYQKDHKSYYVIQGFGAFQGNWGRIGAMYARRHFDQEETGYDFDLISGFVVVKAAKDVDVIARCDRMFGEGFEDHFKGDGVSYVPFANRPGAPFNLFIGGISWEAAKNIWLIPNIKYVFYDDPDVGEKPSKDIYTNMTVWFKF